MIKKNSKNKKNAVFPGSFEIFHEGHYQILEKALTLFDKIYIVVTVNIAKKNILYSLEERQKNIQVKCQAFKERVEVITNNSYLTVDLCQKLNVFFIIRGLKNNVNFQQEQKLYWANRVLNNGIETVFFLSDQKKAKLSSSYLKEIEFFHKKRQKR